MISVVIPAFNAAQKLPACLQALQHQTQPPAEIIVVDDGSTDSTAQVARQCGAQVLNQLHQGPAAARNLGLGRLAGDIVMFTDADCVPTPAWVAEMARPFVDPQVMGVKGSYSTSQPQLVARLVQCEFEERYDLQQRRPSIDLVDSYSAAFRTGLLRQVGGFDPAFPRANNEDVELSYRLDRAGCFLVFNRQAVVSHRHPHTWSAYVDRKVRRGYWRMLVYRMFPGKALRDSYTPQVLKVQIGLIYLALLLLVLAVIFPLLEWGAMLALVALWITAVPFVRRVVRANPGAGPVLAALFFVTLRAFALGLGMIGGLVAMPFFHPTRAGSKREAVSRHV